MKHSSDASFRSGLFAAGGAYLLWGMLPVYWKLLNLVPAMEVLAHRIIWSFVFLLLLLFCSGGLADFKNEVKALLSRRRDAAAMLAAAFLISGNWLVYIWAVQSNHIVESSLGYYINPLVSIALGVVFLKESLSFWQKIACLLALVGVLHLAWQFASFPWVALFLALSFGLYSLCKKIIRIGAINGIALETLLVSPLALFYLTSLELNGAAAFSQNGLLTALLCIGTGVVTATPLILFAKGVKHLPLKVIGFIQYLSPTIALLIGVFVYKEPFTSTHLIAFSFIWGALALVSLAETPHFQALERRLSRKAA